jgi:hypothetical protein
MGPIRAIPRSGPSPREPETPGVPSTGLPCASLSIGYWVSCTGATSLWASGTAPSRRAVAGERARRSSGYQDLSTLSVERL